MNERAEPETTSLCVPAGLRGDGELWPTVFVDARGVNLRDGGSAAVEKINDAIHKALYAVCPEAVSGQALLKVHIGEPKCVTRMRPEYMWSSVNFLREKGAPAVVAGDTTVAYTGPRGHKQNPLGNVSSYLGLAREHGWSEDDAAGIPFVVLDRPCTVVPGRFEFHHKQERTQVRDIRRFKDFYLAGGFAAADLVINHAHLTLHGLAGLAGCLKSIAMGCSALRGKLRMHQCLLPHFDAQICAACGRCVESCPEDALTLNDGDPCPVVDPQRCIGCGECEAVCATGKRAVSLRGEQITDWQRGEDTLPMRMADYAMGLMNGKWDSTVHVLHMYTITERCDCLNVRQTPMTERDIGFLVGRNPFAIDLLAARLLRETLADEGREVDEALLRTASETAAYAEEAYGISRETLTTKVQVS